MPGFMADPGLSRSFISIAIPQILFTLFPGYREAETQRRLTHPRSLTFKSSDIRTEPPQN